MHIKEPTTASDARRPRRGLSGRLWQLGAGTLAAMVALSVAPASVSAGESATMVAAGSTQLLPGFSHGKVTVEGGALHYVRGGSGPALVLLHGWPQTWWAWKDVMPALAANHTVIAFDLPGLGTSGVPATGYDKPTTARRIRAGVNQLGFQQVKILGHDLGALVAYAYARDYPTEVTRIAVLETPLSGFGLEDVYGLSWHFLFNASPAPIPERIMDNEDVSTYLGMMFDFSANPDAIDRSVYYFAYSDPSRRTAGYNYYRAFAQDAADNQANAEAKRLTIPVLAMGAEFVFGAGVAASFSAVASDVRTVVAPGSAHFIPEEVPSFLIDCANLFFGPSSGTPSSPELAGCAP